MATRVATTIPAAIARSRDFASQEDFAGEASRIGTDEPTCEEPIPLTSLQREMR